MLTRSYASHAVLSAHRLPPPLAPLIGPSQRSSVAARVLANDTRGSACIGVCSRRGSSRAHADGAGAVTAAVEGHNEDVKEVYLGCAGGKKRYKAIRSYRRRNRWLS